ncbi:hypothetical protein EAb13_CDS0080 [Acinetobacter phage EAb13]|nr:hypothetical protein EAb13_CDS0080 [Acinetobacter phage EAb13]
MGPFFTPPPYAIPMAKFTIRDHFAGLAMQGMLASIEDQTQLDRLRDWARKNNQTLAEFIASDSYKQADAMIAARTQPAAYGPAKESK